MDTKKLRQKILDLAIHGKLVPQDPNDEPASVLLERIRKEKEQLIKEGKIKAPKKSKSAGDTSHYPKEVPWELPEGWCCATIGELFYLQAGKFVSAEDIHEESTQYPYRCFGGNGIRGYVSRTNRIGEFPIIGRQGALCGNINFASGEFYATEHAVVVESFGGTDPIWARYLLEQLNLNQYATATAQPGLSVKTINEVSIPVPPTCEQHKISKAVSRYLDLIESIHDFEQGLRAETDLVKSRILDLAIHGKLVPQDPSNEPAIEVLKRINPDFTPSDNLHYEDCPNGWQVVTLKEIIILYSGRDLESTCCNAQRRGIPYLVGASCIENKRISVYRWTEYPEVVAKRNDILLSCKGTVGEVVLNQLGNVHIARQFMAIRSKSPQLILPEYVEIMIKSSIDKLRSAARGIIPGIAREDILEMVVAIPPVSEQRQILKRIDEIEKSLALISLNICG